MFTFIRNDDDSVVDASAIKFILYAKSFAVILSMNGVSQAYYLRLIHSAIDYLWLLSGQS